jgi:hypothetical protein
MLASENLMPLITREEVMDEFEVLSMVNSCLGFAENDGMLDLRFRVYDIQDDEILVEFNGKKFRIIAEQIA